MCSLYYLDFPLTFNKSTIAQVLGLARKVTREKKCPKKELAEKKFSWKKWPKYWPASLASPPRMQKKMKIMEKIYF